MRGAQIARGKPKRSEGAAPGQCYWSRPAPRYTIGGRGPLLLKRIVDDIALHLIRPAAGQRGVSLHLYAAPYDHCNVYCPDTGEITRRKLSDYSHRGQLLTQERV